MVRVLLNWFSMKLRTRFDLFSAALLSALGASQVACGGNAMVSAGGQAGSGGSGAGRSGLGGASTGGASTGGVAGSGQSGAATAGTLGNAGADANQYPCLNPQDLGHGFVQCDGFKHRTKADTCTSLVPRPDAANPGMVGMCQVDTDCKDEPYGWCTSGGQLPDTYCRYGCVNDSDCRGDQLCECGTPVGRCVQALCASDADCQNGFLCRDYDSSGGCGSLAYSCQSPADNCGSDADCGAAMLARCRVNPQTQSFQCIPDNCAVGRPFLVEGAQRLAATAARDDWSELTLLPRLVDLDATLSAQLAEQWTRVALMEHASIAAFARFTLQLMSLAAPASLIERATAAMVDETRHAKACFAVASSYASAPLGPGRLAVERSLDESSLTEIVLNTIREGCVGETLAAIEVREAAEHALDPDLRELLLSISQDETRHAELAYRFVSWAIVVGGPELKRAVQREFAALAAEPSAAGGVLTDSEGALLRHGIVPEAMRQAIRRQAMAEVILPCSRTLFGNEARRSRQVNASV